MAAINIRQSAKMLKLKSEDRKRRAPAKAKGDFLLLKGALPYYCAEHLRRAIEGEVHGAERLILSAPANLRGYCCKVLYDHKVPSETFAAALRDAWTSDSQHIRWAAGRRRTLNAWFRYAAFAIPDDLPEELTIWRGGVSKNPRRLALGCAWTTELPQAQWFAFECTQREEGEGLVLRATVRRSDIVAYWPDERDEQEVVTFNPMGVQEVERRTPIWDELAKLCGALRRKAPDNVRVSLG